MKTASAFFLLALMSAPALAQTKTGARTTSKPPASSPKQAPTTTTAPSTTPSPTAVLTELFGAPTGPFKQGSIMANLGLGLGTGYGYSFASIADGSPAISLSAEKGLLTLGPGVLGVGGLVGYKSYRYDYPTPEYKARWTNVVVLGRAAYHYDLLGIENLDTYAGASVGIRIETYKNTNPAANANSINDTSYGGIRFERGIFLGARYLLTKNFGGFAEAGYDMSYLKLGLTGAF